MTESKKNIANGLFQTDGTSYKVERNQNQLEPMTSGETIMILVQRVTQAVGGNRRIITLIPSAPACRLTARIMMIRAQSKFKNMAQRSKHANK